VVRSRKPADGEDTGMADPPSYPDTRGDTGAEPAARPGAGRPRRTVIVVWGIVIALLLVLLILHLTGTLGANLNG
jgi:hypothetical protein